MNILGDREQMGGETSTKAVFENSASEETLDVGISAPASERMLRKQSATTHTREKLRDQNCVPGKEMIDSTLPRHIDRILSARVVSDVSPSRTQSPPRQAGQSTPRDDTSQDHQEKISKQNKMKSLLRISVSFIIGIPIGIWIGSRIGGIATPDEKVQPTIVIPGPGNLESLFVDCEKPLTLVYFGDDRMFTEVYNSTVQGIVNSTDAFYFQPGYYGSNRICDFLDPVSDQAKSVLWLGEDIFEFSKYSNMTTTMTTTTTTSSEMFVIENIDKLLRRYLLGVLHYSTLASFSQSRFQFMTHVDECEWNNMEYGLGVICDNEESIVSIDLHATGLSGRLPDELLLLTDLESLDLSSNSRIFGSFPPHGGDSSSSPSENTVNKGWSDLTKLTNLNLAETGIAGTLPSSSGWWPSNLHILNLESTDLSGTLPAVMFEELQFLEELNVRSNDLSGSIPTEIWSLTTLKFANFEGNNFEGSIEFLCPLANEMVIKVDNGDVECSCCS